MSQMDALNSYTHFPCDFYSTQKPAWDDVFGSFRLFPRYEHIELESIGVAWDGMRWNQVELHQASCENGEQARGHVSNMSTRAYEMKYEMKT